MAPTHKCAQTEHVHHTLSAHITSSSSSNAESGRHSHRPHSPVTLKGKRPPLIVPRHVRSMSAIAAGSPPSARATRSHAAASASAAAAMPDAQSDRRTVTALTCAAAVAAISASLRCATLSYSLHAAACAASACARCCIAATCNARHAHREAGMHDGTYTHAQAPRHQLPKNVSCQQAFTPCRRHTDTRSGSGRVSVTPATAPRPPDCTS